MNAEEIIIKPIVTEKSSIGLQEGKYTFKVAKKATNIELYNNLLCVFKKENPSKVNLPS